MMDEKTKKQIDEWNKNNEILNSELENSSSNRSCVIVAVAYLDILLRNLLGSFLSSPHNNKEDDELFTGYGPLSSFSSRIIIASRLGLISDYEYRALQIVRKIRNSFAHNLTGDSLDDYKQWLLQVIPPRELIPVKYIPLALSNDDVPPLPVIPKIDETSSRDLFVKIVMCLSNLLATRHEMSIRQKRKVPDNIKSLIDVEDLRIKVLQDCLDDSIRLGDRLSEAIDSFREKLEKFEHNGMSGSVISESKEELESLEKDLEIVFEDCKDIDNMISMNKYIRNQIQKAFDAQS